MEGITVNSGRSRGRVGEGSRTGGVRSGETSDGERARTRASGGGGDVDLIGSQGSRGNIQPAEEVANPQGFQAWLNFMAKERAASTHEERQRAAGPNGDRGKATEPDRTNEPAAANHVEDDWGAGITWAMWEEMAVLPILEGTHSESEEVVKLMNLDVPKAASKLGQYRKTAAILQAMESTPSRDRVVGWLRETLVIRRGVRIQQVKVLDRREFLVVFQSIEDKEKAMNKPPAFLDGKLVRLIDWDKRDAEKLKAHLKPAWVEMRGVPPFLEDQVGEMLATVGPVAYQAIDKQTESRYTNIRGCVLVDMSEELPKSVGIQTPWDKTYLQKITYTKLPDHCFICLQKGHWARSYPDRQQGGRFDPRARQNAGGIRGGGEMRGNEMTRAMEPTVAEEEAEFVPVQNKGSRGNNRAQKETLATTSNNLFSVLRAEGEEDMEAEGSKEPPDETVGVGGSQPGKKNLGVSEMAGNPQTGTMEVGITSQVQAAESDNGVKMSTEDEDMDSSEFVADSREGDLTKNDRKSKGKEIEVEIEEETCLAVSIVREAVKSCIPVEVSDLTMKRKLSRNKCSMGEVQNPFKSHGTVLEKEICRADLGHEVSFVGSEFLVRKQGRGPKKKKGDKDVNNGGEEKRRALGTLDQNGCRFADRSTSSNGTIAERRKGRKRIEARLKFFSDMLSQLNLVSWNVRGVGRPNKAKAVKNWVVTKAKEAQIIGLQEVKVARWSTERWLKSLRKRGTVIFDKPIGKKGGTALILAESVRVVVSGTSGRGRMAWAQVEVEEKRFGVISVHAPNKRRARLTFWEDMRNIMRVGEWIILGDFNNVELLEDARGKSALVRGREARLWRLMAVENGLVDCFFCSAVTEGVRFTRFARRRNRIDTSRLDRVYVSHGAQWIEAVRKITHFGSNVLSDHVPVSVEIQLVPAEGNRKIESYFKANPWELKVPEVMQKIREAWGDETEIVKDERRKWARSWARVRKVMKEFRRGKDRARREEGDLEQEVAWRRGMLTSDATVGEVEALDKLEKKLKDRNLQDARMWRLRSRERWLTEDEAPSRYFFAKLKAKWTREAIEVLKLDGGEETTDREVIMDEIFEFYQVLYDKEEDTEVRRAAREELLSLVVNKLSPEESSDISRVPNKAEIEDIVFTMKSNKSPGVDGMIIEFVQTYWDLVGDDCVRLITTVWAKRKLLRSDCEGVIKLIHKGGEKAKLGNWRPISLMTLTYKIVNKLLANRVRIVLPKLVDPQQSGFVKSRQITNNVLSLKIGQEWADWSSQDVLFVKLDFVKAYDRVDHQFLWRTLEVMGFDDQFVSLVKGFSVGGTARVHTNGSFSKVIQVRRGVRQGCPLAPLLYAICTQPFMAQIRRAEEEGKLRGLFIEPGKVLTHQLFADDTGVCIQAQESEFQELIGILEKYELASGAKINLAKSLVMPMGRQAAPEWVKTKGCVVVEAGNSFRYLGIIAGVNLPEDTESLEVCSRMRRRLFQWENFHLPWTARVVLIKHILSQIPTYMLLTVGCVKKESVKLERLIREFLWGTSPDGKPKKALIAWSRVIKPKSQGGLGFLSLEARSKSLQMRHLISVIENAPAEWVQMMRRMFRVKFMTWPNKLERTKWKSEEALIMLRTWSIGEAPTVNKLLKVWFSFRARLTLDKEVAVIPNHLPVKSLKEVWSLTQQGGGEAFKEIEFNAKRNRLVTVQELRNFIQDLGEEEMEVFLGTQAEGREADKVRRWVRSARLVEKSLTEIDGWSWMGEEQVQKAWSKPVKDWLRISREKNKTFANLSRRWGRIRETEVWLWRWKVLWNSKLALRQKLWIWRILHRGLASLSRIEKWGLSDGLCMGCQSEKETPEHLLWGCSRIRNRMEWLTLTVTGEEFHASSFFDVLDTALRAQKQNLGPLLLVCEVSKQCWLERNRMVFDNIIVEISLTGLLLKVKAGEGTLLKKVKEDVRRRMQARQNEFWRRAEHVIEEIKRREEVLHDICDVIEGWSTVIGEQSSGRAEEGRDEDSESSEEDSSVSGNGTGESDSESSGLQQSSEEDVNN
ncbi:hypothetical protein R1sor_001788 [Riccia sorocarpa]|uniref:Reverse transcriptase domain-containing protein n=1 Tax=Riccia sorocarpa TaxID=122646 RepID=A0ABD3GYK4_9MARC